MHLYIYCVVCFMFQFGSLWNKLSVDYAIWTGIIFCTETSVWLIYFSPPKMMLWVQFAWNIAVKIVAIFWPSKRMHSSHEQLPISRSRILTGAVKLFQIDSMISSIRLTRWMTWMSLCPVPEQYWEGHSLKILLGGLTFREVLHWIWSNFFFSLRLLQL